MLSEQVRPAGIVEMERDIRDEDLKALEDYKQGKADSPVIYKPYGWVKANGQGDMIFIANEESVDRVGDIIKIDGWLLDNFKKNPVLMFSHDYSIPALGTVPEVWTEKKQLLNTVRWDEEDPFARFIKGKYDRGIMRAVSVGFKALDYEELETGILFKRQELLEISLVLIPSHPKALKKAISNVDSSLWISKLWNDTFYPDVKTKNAEKDLAIQEKANLNVDIEFIRQIANEIRDFTKE